MERKPKKQPASLGRLLANATKEIVIFLITIGMIVLAALAIINRDRLNLDGVKRWVTYGSLNKDESGQTEEFNVPGDSKCSFSTLDGGVVVCSNRTLQLFSSSGKEVVNQQITMNNPVIHVEGGYAVVYDVGGKSLYVIHNSDVSFEYTAQDTCQILSARVNESGYLALVEQTAGHKATVTVYDDQHNPRIGINESTNFVTDAVVSPDNRSVALVEIYQSDSSFETDLVMYNVSDATKKDTSRLGESLVIDLRWRGNRIWTQRESGVTVLDRDGNIINSWSETNKYLVRCSLDGSGFAVEYLSKYKSGSAGELRIIGEDGEQSVSRSISEEVLSVSAAGKYVAVLTTNSLVIYKDDLQEYASIANTDTRRAIMRDDGSVLLIGTEKARLFIPG